MPAHKFIADMDISPLTVEKLKEKGWAIQRVSELENELNQGIVVSVDNNSARYRNLPID